MTAWMFVFGALNALIAFLVVMLARDLRALHVRWTERGKPRTEGDPFVSGFLGYVLSNTVDDDRPQRRRIVRIAAALILVLLLARVALVRLLDAG